MKIQKDWNELLKEEYEKPYFKGLSNFVKNEYLTKTIYPKQEEIFNAFLYTSYKDTKLLLLGQDPYITEGFPHGLAFSVNYGIQIPKSLKNIYKELHDDLGCKIPNHGNLLKWAKQGVLLLNTLLTVVAGQSNSHQGKGWELFTDKVISLLNKKNTPMVFVLWGNNARSKKPLITNNEHLIIESAHPSPLSASRGFLGSKPFSKANRFFEQNEVAPIDWQIEDL